jgi:hypothetical protein
MDTKEINILIDLLNEEERYKRAFNKQIQLLECEQPLLYPKNSYPFLKVLARRIIDVRKQIDQNLETFTLDFHQSAS